MEARFSAQQSVRRSPSGIYIQHCDYLYKGERKLLVNLQFDGRTFLQHIVVDNNGKIHLSIWLVGFKEDARKYGANLHILSGDKDNNIEGVFPMQIASTDGAPGEEMTTVQYASFPYLEFTKDFCEYKWDSKVFYWTSKVVIWRKSQSELERVHVISPKSEVKVETHKQQNGRDVKIIKEFLTYTKTPPRQLGKNVNPNKLSVMGPGL